MRVKDISNGDEYFIDLYEKWWQYPLMPFTWFLKHKAYPYKEKDKTEPYKFKYDVKMALAGVFGSTILGDFVRKIDIVTIPSQYHLFIKYLVYPIAVYFTFIAWNFIKDMVKKRKVVKFNTHKYVRLKITSFNGVKKILYKTIAIVISFLFILESIRITLFGMFLISSIAMFILVLSSIIFGEGVGVVIINNELQNEEL